MKMQEGEPGTPGWTGRMDQAEAGSYDLARVWAAYHRSMIDQGMGRAEATCVLMAYVCSINLATTFSTLIKDLGKNRDKE
jgi:hypothetical protein